MGARKLWTIVIAAGLAALAAFWLCRSPAAREAAQAVDQTAGEVTGARAVGQGQELRSDLKSISDEQKSRLRRIGLDGGAESR